MNYLINQRGSTLVITLIIIVLFSVLGFGLVTLNTSASKQFDNKEQTVQARHFAEMGLVHYKSEVINAINKHNSDIDKIKIKNSLTAEQKADEINMQNDLLCDKLSGTAIVNSVNTKDPNYEISTTHCSLNATSTLLAISVESEGKSLQGKVVNVDLNLTIERPEPIIKGNGTLPPAIPIPPTSGGSSTSPPAIPPPPASESEINKIWPCTNANKNDCSYTINNYTDVSLMGTAIVKKGNLLFNNSLVMNNLEVEPGNGLNLTVKQDLFLKGGLDAQTHACIAVGGNFTATTSILSKNKLYIYIHGDAHFTDITNLTSSNNEIFVSGDVYINGKKQEPKTYKPVTGYSKNCSLPGIPSTSIPTETDSNLQNTEYVYIRN